MLADDETDRVLAREEQRKACARSAWSARILDGIRLECSSSELMPRSRVDVVLDSRWPASSGPSFVKVIVPKLRNY